MLMYSTTPLQLTFSWSISAIFNKVININYLQGREKNSMQNYVNFICQVGMK